MFSSVPPQPSSLMESPASPSPSPTGRSSRGIRGLSYLRSYTHNHILSRDNHHSTSTSPGRTSSTAPTTSYRLPSVLSPSLASNTSALQTSSQISPSAQRNTTDLSSDPDNSALLNSGWLPTVGGQNGALRLPTEPQHSAAAVSSTLWSADNSAAEMSTSMRRNLPSTVGGTTDRLLDDVQALNEPPASNCTSGMAHQLPSIRFSAHQDPRAQRPSLVFNAISRILPTGKETIKVGRYSEKESLPLKLVNAPCSAPVGFKSKVVSRRHCEFWCTDGRWYIKDVKSSSGTFLNHIRLSSPGTESRPFPVNDGDIVQLGIDFKGGEEMIFRCVKIRIELNKGWQNQPSRFNVQSHKRLRELNSFGKAPGSGSSQDCSICLGPIAPCQSLFVAPCSHTWHYKCIRVIINGPHWPHFTCPNCRSVADLEAELDELSLEEEETRKSDHTDSSNGPSNMSAAPGAIEREEHGSQIFYSEETVAEPIPEVLAESEKSAPAANSESDLEAPEGSGRDKDDHTATNTADDMDYVHVDGSPTSSGPSIPEIFNATVSPVDIVRRKSRSNSCHTSQLERPGARRIERHSRTPSPNGLGSSLNDGTNTVEGPLTPRNNLGPFVFDGSDDNVRSSAARVATMNLNTAAHPPSHPSSIAEPGS